MKDISRYIKGHIESAELEEKEIKRLYGEVYEKAMRAAEVLGKSFGAKRVYLFGSLTSPELFKLSSDIDLAVEGVESSRYLDAWGAVEMLMEHPFDLVQLERVKMSFRKAILEEGELIYESEREKGQPFSSTF